ncbi:acetyl-CoA carboxylase carboxyltransferase component [Cupriavidus metallidurans]|uniref:acyl-CoA carboxylase subunit beta n=1 Tax=Cupriavidus TaxID=106589 RepID=UPI0004935E42|nr:carboxyl transferase domain-containing protein [Cupriavidus metallidurans]AVA34118.1 methylmalonyl-CoA carboxyltransferase [Cupriavidus metallidurans]KWW35059.1 Methylmalonyl-CoA carboxyltransferase 12S subunit [Cupriavidus metallidurans]MDE4922244.1 carboxyl transferase domain-containing protein [Cupriavidus metallidurans]QWC90686.1 methylmalonyl-CoA carboxyltransferase [Cupriavidus metallidurans]
MTWQPEIDELAYRRRLAARMGGEEKVARHKAAGKLSVRERIAGIADPGTFREVGGLSGSGRYDSNGRLVDLVPSNLVMGRANVGGRPVVLVGDDFTVRGGANDGAVGDKLIHAEKMAHDLRLPMVRLVDGTGGGGSVRNVEIKGHTLIPTMKVWEHVVENMAVVPVVSLALGSVAGMGAARVAASHYSVMVRETSQLFYAGPPAAAPNEQGLTKNELGGSHIHSRNGVVDDEVATEQEAFARARDFLSYLPASVHELPPRVAPADDPARRDEWLLAAIPRDGRATYEIRPILEALVDAGSFFEIGRHWGCAIVTGLARLDGWPVAVVASDPRVQGGSWDSDTAEKFTRIVDLAQAFHLPVVNLVDTPGFQSGLDAERAGTTRRGVRALAAVYQATVPWCSIILRRAYGVAAAAHQHMGRFNFRYAWPSANWGEVPIEGGLEVAYKSEIEGADDPVQKRAEIMLRVRSLTSPFRSAEAFVIEDIIDPRETRALLCEFANLAAPLREAGVSRFGIRP